MKTVLVTGGSGGIGSAICRSFAENGYSVAIAANNNLKGAQTLAEKLKSAGYDACAFAANITSLAECERLVNEVLTRFGKIDVLVNNAGVSLIKTFTECTEADYETVMDLNFRAAVRLSKLVLPGMISRKSGRIVNVSSMWGISGASCETLYSASKAALIGFTQALGKEMARSGILINAVAPGVIDTKMNDEVGKEALSEIAESTPSGRIGRPEEVAECVLFLAEKNHFLIGQTITPDGGFL